ncbi:UDP-3-O-(3-hydroxymyristoyl)glucosamine N-acyltransferase [Roseibacillus persicicus]|uniref:UDP-3-O-(3-hydroxymyristoyl)glucosamine N-acyltransferase n=1 Tax=Roseibacillus persicicus TaxID=454148 RepID=UPI00398B44F4
MDFTVSEIIALCGGRLRVGDPDFRVNGFAALDDAGPEDLSFLGNEKYINDYLSSAAGVVLVVPQAPIAREGMVLIDVENPSLAFSQICEAVQSKRPFAAEVHPTAYVDPTAEVAGVMVRANAVIEAGARIGRGTEIGPGVVIERDAVVGEDCILFANSVVRERCLLGDRVLLQPGAVIGSEGFGYEFVDGRHRSIPQVGIVVLEDEVEVGANSTIDRARFGKTTIGKGSKIDNLVQIGHNVVVGEHCLIVAHTGIAGSCTIGNNVTIAAQCGLAGHLEVGDNVVLAARTGVSKSITKPGIYWGVPAVPIHEEKKSVVFTRNGPAFRKELKLLRKEVNELKESRDS